MGLELEKPVNIITLYTRAKVSQGSFLLFLRDATAAVTTIII